MKKILLVKIFFLIQILLLSSFEIVNAATKAEKIKEIQDSVDIAQKELENCRGKSCEASAAAKYDEAFNNYDDAWSGRTTVDQAYDNLGNSSGDSGNGSSSDTEFGAPGAYDAAVANQADTEFGAPGAYDAAVANEAASPSSEKYTGTDFSAGKSNTTDSTSSSYYNNNLKENSLTKDSFSSLEKAGYVNADGSLTEAGKLASGQTDGKCGTECAKNLNSKAAAAGKSASSGGPDDLTSTDFIINVDSISPGINSKGSNTTERVNWILGTLIQNMMIGLGILSVLIMTIGSGYIIFHNGQDELLSKGKSIFMSGVYAMIIALTSYYLISIVRYMLYS